jgi:hypothetical protein
VFNSLLVVIPDIRIFRFNYLYRVFLGLMSIYIWLRNQCPIFGSGKRCSFLHGVQTGSEAHPATKPMGTGGFILEDKVARA